MNINQMYNYVLARAKALNGKEVVGYLTVNEYAPREHFYKLYNPEIRRTVLVDPMTVEIFTGMRDAIAPEKRIFEGDVVQLFTMNGTTIDVGAPSFEYDYLGEICMPLVIGKEGASKRLYLHTQRGVEEGGVSDGFDEIASQFDCLEYNIVGRVDDEWFDTGANSMLDVREISKDEPEMVSLTKGLRVWNAYTSTELAASKACKFLGSFSRRKHIIRRMFQNDYFLTLVRRHPEFEKLVPKWKDEYERYYKIWQ